MVSCCSPDDLLSPAGPLVFSGWSALVLPVISLWSHGRLLHGLFGGLLLAVVVVVVVLVAPVVMRVVVYISLFGDLRWRKTRVYSWEKASMGLQLFLFTGLLCSNFRTNASAYSCRRCSTKCRFTVPTRTGFGV